MESKTMPQVFLWMFIGLLVTFITGYGISINQNMIETISKSSIYIILAIVEVVLVIVLSLRIRKMNPATCRVMFLLYSFISGLTFSSIFIYYKLTSIMFVFLITALIFGIFAFIGYVTKLDLTKLGTYLFMALIGVMICFIINIFVSSIKFDLVLSAIVVLIFVAFTAYDVQKIKNSSGIIPEENIPIYGAFQLYLDYINIFIHLLQYFGKEK